MPAAAFGAAAFLADAGFFGEAAGLTTFFAFGAAFFAGAAAFFGDAAGFFGEGAGAGVGATFFGAAAFFGAAFLVVAV